MRRTLLLLVTLLAATPCAGAEQHPGPVAPGTPVRVSSPALPSSPLQGDVVAIGTGALTFRPLERESVLTVQAERIARLEVRGRPRGHAGTGAVIGGAMFGLMGIMLGVAVSSDSFLGGGNSAGENTAGTVMLGVLGGVAGAGAGALIGSAVITPHWIALTPEQMRATFAPAADSSATPATPDVKR